MVHYLYNNNEGCIYQCNKNVTNKSKNVTNKSKNVKKRQILITYPNFVASRDQSYKMDGMGRTLYISTDCIFTYDDGSKKHGKVMVITVQLSKPNKNSVIRCKEDFSWDIEGNQLYASSIQKFFLSNGYFNYIKNNVQPLTILGGNGIFFNAYGNVGFKVQGTFKLKDKNKYIKEKEGHTLLTLYQCTACQK